MKYLSLILWLTQFGISAVVPLCLCLWLGTWLQETFQLGWWVLLLCGVFGLLISVRTVVSCLHAMRNEAESLGTGKETGVSFNDHE